MAAPSPDLLQLLNRVLGGEASRDELIRRIDVEREVSDDAGVNSLRRIENATIDLGRDQRCGFGEVIYGEGKSSDLVTQIIRQQLDVGQAALVTRIDSEAASQVQQAFEHSQYHPVARTLRVGPQTVNPSRPISALEAEKRPNAAVVTAGSTDLPVAEEAIETLTWMGIPFQRFDDIGVAGPQRLAEALPALRSASVVVVVAGMEGALPSVVGGHLSVPVFAVPTSVGYGASLGGLTALMGMLTACVSSVAVVNIDAGFKGGYLAGLVVRQLQLAEAKVGTAARGSNAASQSSGE